MRNQTHRWETELTGNFFRLVELRNRFVYMVVQLCDWSFKFSWCLCAAIMRKESKAKINNSIFFSAYYRWRCVSNLLRSVGLFSGYISVTCCNVKKAVRSVTWLVHIWHAHKYFVYKFMHVQFTYRPNMNSEWQLSMEKVVYEMTHWLLTSHNQFKID